jgi:hypothetical protein
MADLICTGTWHRVTRIGTAPDVEVSYLEAAWMGSTERDEEALQSVSLRCPPQAGVALPYFGAYSEAHHE